MAVRSYKMGPGKLTLDPAGTPFEVNTQLLNGRVETAENVSEGETLTVLSDETVTEDDEVTYRSTFSGRVLQDLDATGFVAYTWDNKGAEVAFTFQPRDDTARAVTGTVIVSPVTIGGDVKTRPQSDFTWRIKGDPVFVTLGP